MSAGKLYVEVDGTVYGQLISPETVEAVAFLRVALAYVEALSGRLQRRGVALRGAAIENKCVAYAVMVDDLAIGADESAVLAADINNIASDRQDAKRVREAVVDMPEAWRIRVGGAATLTELDAPRLRRELAHAASQLTVEAREEAIVVLQAGLLEGGVTGTLRVRRVLADKPLTLRCSTDDAKALGRLLGEVVQARFQVEVDADGGMSGGELLGLEAAAADGSAFEAWVQDAWGGLSPEQIRERLGRD